MANARSLDLKEVALMQGKSIWELEVDRFENTQVLIDEHENVYAIGGLADFKGKLYVWMLCTTMVDKYPVKFLKFIKSYYKAVIHEYKEMENYVWLGNDQHVRWLKWLGAQFYEKQQFNGQDFQRFVLKEGGI